MGGKGSVWSERAMAWVVGMWRSRKEAHWIEEGRDGRGRYGAQRRQKISLGERSAGSRARSASNEHATRPPQFPHRSSARPPPLSGSFDSANTARRPSVTRQSSAASTESSN